MALLYKYFRFREQENVAACSDYDDVDPDSKLLTTNE
jgi:hypothetical protein